MYTRGFMINEIEVRIKNEPTIAYIGYGPTGFYYRLGPNQTRYLCSMSLIANSFNHINELPVLSHELETLKQNYKPTEFCSID